MKYRLGFIGAGNMAEAIARGALAAHFCDPQQIAASDVSQNRRELFLRELGAVAVESNATAANTQTLILSVKPQQMAAALAGLGGALDPGTLIISIAAGITCRFVERALGPSHPWRIVRAMPNTPMLVGEGMVGIAPGPHATPDDLLEARRLFETSAEVIEVSESKLDAITAISGSGPAYFFYLVEHMIRAGVELGLSPDDARLLAIRTASGSAKMLALSSDGPVELRRKVTSPGGTTQAAIEVLDQRAVPQAIVDALSAAARRASELAQ
jgi:pyrroline-5-carboxylate reductase